MAGSSGIPYGNGQNGIGAAGQIDINALPTGRLDRAPGLRNERGRGEDGQWPEVSFLYQSETKPGTLALWHLWSPSGRLPLGQRPCDQCIRASRPQRTCRAGEWRSERRDFRADCHVARVDGGTAAIRLMTDSDRTGALVEGWDGDIILQVR
jgi:hypothetical protein